MALTDNRVKFLRGLQANLASITPSAATSGNIYVTTDERAMYIDHQKSDGSYERIRLGDFREYADWAAIRALPTTGLSTTALYYAAAENILCKYTGTGWKQINKQQDIDALIKAITQTVTVSSNTATITQQLQNSSGVNIATLTSSHKITTADADAIKLSVNNGELVMRGRNVSNEVTASVATDAGNTTGTITLTNTYTGTDSAGTAVNTTTTSAFKIAGSGLKVTKNTASDGLILTSGYHVDATLADSNKTLKIGLTDVTSDYATIIAASQMGLKSKITVGQGTTTDVEATVTYANRVATFAAALPVYTASQVDTLLADALTNINAMTFKGSIAASGGTVTAPPLTANTVKIGDTYIVADANGGNYSINAAGTKQSAIKGDMFIATSTTNTENSLGYIEAADIKWVYVPSGDDAQHSYTLKSATQAAASGVDAFDYVYLENEASVKVPNSTAIGIGAGLDYDSRSVTKGGTALVLKHKAYTTTEGTPDAAVSITNKALATGQTDNGTITAITGITVDNGHITGYKTKTFSVSVLAAIQSSKMSVTSAADATAGTTTATIKAIVTNTAGVDQPTTAMTMTSKSLTLSHTSATALNVDLLWETF